MTKPYKVLLAYDGSPSAKKGLADLERAGIPEQARIRIFSVVVPWIRYAIGDEAGLAGWPSSQAVRQYGRLLDDQVEASRLAARKAADALSARHPGWTLEVEVVLDDAAPGILTQAKIWKPDLLVVGARGLSGFGKLLLGSVSEKVLHGRASGIRIVRARLRRSDRPLRILLGFDGSPGALKALKSLGSRAWPAGTQVRLVGALEPLRGHGVYELGSGITGDSEDRRDRAPALRALKSASSTLVRAGLGTEIALLTGDARRVLLDEARRFGAECIVVGTRGRKGLGRFLVGSVALAVAAHAPCTVEIA